VRNYVEPFFGSGAVLLGRGAYSPDKHIETVNDIDGYVANFWRAVQADPESIARFAEWPVNEADLTARHIWLRGQRESFLPRLMADPDYYDVKIAGWWVWGICCWIGSGWCGEAGKGPWVVVDGQLKNKKDIKELVGVDDMPGVVVSRPHLRIPVGVKKQLPRVSEEGNGVKKKLPQISTGGQGVKKHTSVLDWMTSLSERIKKVRVCCGDWSRVCGKSPTYRNGLTGVFLDPPYSHKGRDEVYSEDSYEVANDTRKWCIENGDNPLLRIALCGYDGEHNELEKLGWEVVAWKAHGGYANRNGSARKDNKTKERIWFSPHCISESILVNE
jgi:site-specific DNA-adenine methylase